MGAFAIALFEDGGMQYETMSVEDIQNVRNTYSNAANSKAWKNSFDEMAKKVVLRRLCKHIDCDFESIEARKAWEDGSVSEMPTIEREKETDVVDVFSSAQPVDVIDSTCTEVSEEQLDAECKEVFG